MNARPLPSGGARRQTADRAALAPAPARTGIRSQPAPGEPPSERTIILGLGNDILSDDGVGLRVAAVLRERLADDGRFTIVETMEMGLSLLDFIVGFDDLVVVDAVLTGQVEPGFIHELDGEDLAVLQEISPHFLGVGEMLALGRLLGLAMPRQARILAIEVGDPFTVGTCLTPALEQDLPRIVERVLATLRRPA